MLHPSFKEMIQKMNENAGEDNKKITSRYSLVIAAAKRARQVNAGSDPLVEASEKAKNLSVAVDEIYAGKVNILEDDQDFTENYYVDPSTLPAEFADVDYNDEDEEGEENEENEDDVDVYAEDDEN